MTAAPADTREAPDRSEAPDAPPPPPGESRSRARLLAQVLGLPLVLAAVVAGLAVYLANADLDSIEARLLATDVLRAQTIRHIELVAVSTVLVIGLAVPLGIAATRPSMRRVAPAIVGLGNVAQTVPSFGVLVLFAVLYGIGFWPSILALVLYAFLPVLRNTIVGLLQVDRFVVESARAMGLSSSATLRRIELPLAVPVILAGVRTAAVINVGTATIAALINAGGLGEVVYQGITNGRTTAFVVGAILTGVLALLVDHVLGLTERALRPRGL